MGPTRLSRAAVLALFVAAPAAAQSFDCARARTPIEQAICGSAALAAQDRALNDAYIAARANLRDDSPEAAALRDSQRAWISGRNRSCGDGDPVCLAAAYRARLGSISALAKAAPAAPSPAPQAQAPQPAPAPAPRVVVEPVVAGAATLSAATAPAAGEGQTLLTVAKAGRFVVTAKSASGVGLQLVDMIAGPGEVAGEAGLRDGRLDLLLDAGVYKLKTFGAKDAKGEAALAVRPFREFEAADAQLGDGHSATLGDLQQRSFWLAVGKDGAVSVEAVGRALQDMRLWRDGRDMAELSPVIATVEPKAGKPMTRIRLEGKVEPGAWLVTAYGGVPAVWTDGDAAAPFRIRAGEPAGLTAGVAEGVIGAFGSVRFRAAPEADLFSLELPEIAPATLSAQREGGAASAAFIGKTSREPVALLGVARPKDARPALVEISGREGQSFRLQGLARAGSLGFSGVGPHLVSVALARASGDEPPATAVLARTDGKARVIASSAIRLGPGQAWRRKFNLRGTTTLIFETTAAGPVAIRTQGPGVRATIEPLLGAAAPRADGRVPGKYDLEAGWYLARLEPNANARGAVDVTIGAPGLTVEPSQAPAPPRIDFGQRTLERGASYQLLVNTAPGLVAAPRAAALPADLGKGALALAQSAPETAPSVPRVNRPTSPPPRRAASDAAPPREPPRRVERPGPPPPPARPPVAPAPASNALDIPVRAPLGGEIVVTDERGQRVAALVADEKAEKTSRTLTLKIPPSDRARALGIAWRPAPAPRGAVAAEPPQATAALRAGEPIFFDLRRDEKRAFRLEVPRGGLMRVETLGRLKTSAIVGTSFVPKLDEADDNGAGHNALLQTYLRAGAYRVAVTASESAGRLGLVARPATLTGTPTLAPGGSVRATLGDGEGAIIPVEVAQGGVHRLDLYTLGDEPMARLEDADGWPLTAPDRMGKIEQRFEPGRYRLVLAPESVETRVVARLRPVAPETARDGHGPFDLAFDRTTKHQWREPAAAGAPRAPDVWRFTLAGEADVTLDISEGMIGELIRGDSESLARIAAKRGHRGKLAAGAYRFETRALGRDDRLDYQITLKSAQLQPGAPRFVDVPEAIPFTLAEDRVVSIASFGRSDMTAALKDADGRVVERLEGRRDDWNLSFSKLLPAGAYTLVLSEVAPANASGESAGEEEGGGADSSGEGGEADASAVETEPEGKVELRLGLPQPTVRDALAFSGAARAEAGAIHRFGLPQAEAGRLVAVAASGAGEALLSLERRQADGRWRVMATDRGRSALVAFIADGEAQSAWRVSAWTPDGDAPLTLAARAAQEPAQKSGSILLSRLAFEGVAGAFCAARVEAPPVGLVGLSRVVGVTQASRPGRALSPVDDAPFAPQSGTLWIAAREGCEAPMALASTPPAATQSLRLDEGERAHLAAPGPEAGKARVWRADSGFGQPGLDAGRGMGVAAGSAIALSDSRAAKIWNGGATESLRLDVSHVDVTLAGMRDLDGVFSAVLPPRGAQSLRLPVGEKRLLLDLTAGTAAIAGAQEARRVTAWSGKAPLSRALEGAFGEVLLVNLSDAPAPVSVALAPAGPAGLDAGRVFKRFVGAAGSLALPVAAQAGDTLTVVGADATFVGADGGVARGARLDLAGAGELTLAHGPGLVVAWLTRGGKTPWPTAPAKATSIPASLALSGEAMSFALSLDRPMLVTARSSAPLIAAIRQAGAEAPMLFPAGAALARYLPAGEATLDVFSPHDGALAGALELTASPVKPIGEGLGEPLALAPGAVALFGFEVKRAGEIGVGLRSDPDRARARLLDASGKEVAAGVNAVANLAPGRYVLEARAPADGGTLVVRPALVGVSPPSSGPPDDVAKEFLDMVGLKTGTK